MVPDVQVPSMNTRRTDVPGPAPGGRGTETAHESAGIGADADTSEGTMGSPEWIAVAAVTPTRVGITIEPEVTGRHSMSSEARNCPRAMSTAAKGNSSVARSVTSHTRPATTRDVAAIHRR